MPNHEIPNVGAVVTDSHVVSSHLSTLQNIIARMAENSRSCKTWCITIVAAILVLGTRSTMPDHFLIALIPTTLFFGMDSYYVALERAFRKLYDQFVCKLHAGTLDYTELYRIKYERPVVRLFVDALRALATWPFYVSVVVLVLVAWRWID